MKLAALALAGSLALCAGTSSQAQSSLPPATTSLAPMVDEVTPGVVGISVSQTRQSDNPLLNDPAFRRFFEDSDRKDQRPPRGGAPRPDEVRPAGSGVIVDAKQGIVLTNHHVIQGASKLVVVLKDRREFEAQLVGSDAGTDIAVLKIRPERLTEVKLGDSDSVRVGDYVVAIGNPFGLGQTVTGGIVSALSRGLSPEGYEDYIQTDAAINPGNSGGALVNLRGELMGINTAILTGGEGARGNIGIGFAVPTAMAREVMAQILKHGEVRRGRIGIQVAEVTQSVATARGLSAISGALISEVAKGSAAERAGIRVNDVVLRINGRPVRTGSDLRNRVALVPVGETAEFQLIRDGKPGTARVTVEAITAPTVAAGKPSESPSGSPAGSSLEGMQLAAAEGGIQVVKVQPGSPAHSVGFRDGDQIVAVDRQAVQSPRDFAAAMQRPGRKIIVVLRGDTKLRLSVG